MDGEFSVADLVVPVGSVRFCALIALMTSTATDRWTAEAFGLRSTMIWRAFRRTAARPLRLEPERLLADEINAVVVKLFFGQYFASHREL